MFSLESYRIRITLFMGVLAVLVAAGLSSELQAQFLENLDWAKLAYVLAAFFILALLVERCVEVLVNYLFGPKESEISAPVIKAISGAELQKQITNDSLSVLKTPEERTAFLGNTLGHEMAETNRSVMNKFDTAKGEMLKLKVPKHAVAILIACLIGLAISAAGFRILTTLMCVFQANQCTLGDQTLVFKSADLLVSSLLLAGGADGIHGIIRRIFGPTGELDLIAKRIGLNPAL